MVNVGYLRRGEPVGTVGATYGVGIDMELMALEGTEQCGAAVDMAKYFDMVPREVVYKLMHAAGMPRKVVGAYKRFQEELRIRNTIGGALGNRYRARMGIPQGDPFSMMIAALIMRPWAVMMRVQGVYPYLFVDDIMLMTRGQGRV